MNVRAQSVHARKLAFVLVFHVVPLISRSAHGQLETSPGRSYAQAVAGARVERDRLVKTLTGDLAEAIRRNDIWLFATSAPLLGEMRATGKPLIPLAANVAMTATDFEPATTSVPELLKYFPAADALRSIGPDANPFLVEIIAQGEPDSIATRVACMTLLATYRASSTHWRLARRKAFVDLESALKATDPDRVRHQRLTAAQDRLQGLTPFVIGRFEDVPRFANQFNLGTVKLSEPVLKRIRVLPSLASPASAIRISLFESRPESGRVDIRNRLPEGLSLNGSGLIRGAPTESGTFVFEIEARVLPANFYQNVRSFQLVVADQEAAQ